MSLLADLHEEALENTTVMAAIAQFRGDPELTEYATLIALVKVLVAQNAQLTQQCIDLRNKALPEPLVIAAYPGPTFQPGDTPADHEGCCTKERKP